MPTPASSSDVPDDILRLRLFVAGHSARSGRAEANLRVPGEDVLGGRFELEVVGIVSEPDRAEEERILATPTVIRMSPPPRRRVTGDLSRRDDVLQALLPDRIPSASTDAADAADA